MQWWQVCGDMDRGAWAQTGDTKMRGAGDDSFDLAESWEAHCRCEFETRDADPDVNHIPTMTDGVRSDEWFG